MNKKFIVGIVSGLVLIGLIVFLVVIFTKKNTSTHKPEVYLISTPDISYTWSYDDAMNYVTIFDPNAKMATKDQLTQAFNNGAQWCLRGWVQNKGAGYPMQVTGASGCGSKGINFADNNTLPSQVHVFGVKPSLSDVSNKTKNPKGYHVSPFYRPAGSQTGSVKWSQFD